MKLELVLHIHIHSEEGVERIKEVIATLAEKKEELKQATENITNQTKE